MSDPKWYCWKGEIQSGPYSETQLRQMIQAGMILPIDRVRREDWETWVDASMLPASAATPVESVLETVAPNPSGHSTSTGDVRRLSRIAWYYRWINRLAIPYVVLWLVMLVGFGFIPTKTKLQIQLPWLVLGPPAFFSFGRALGRRESVIGAAVGWIPILNLAVLLGLNRVAGRLCRAADWNIGIAGRDPREAKSIATTGWTIGMLILLAAAVSWAIGSMAPHMPTRPSKPGPVYKLASPTKVSVRFEVRRGHGVICY